MVLFVFKDNLIKETEYQQLCNDFTVFMQKHAGITPQFITQNHDFTTVPTERDSDGDLKPVMAYRKYLADTVHRRFGEFGVDHIIPLVHEDNWVFKGIWGTNWSNIFYTYHMSLCRFDKRNPANSFGTLYHEIMHSFDALIYTAINVTVDIGLNWDKFCVHGGRPDLEKTTKWKYIRYQENTEALELIAELLRKSYAKRREMQRVQLMGTYNGLLKTMVGLLQNKLMKLRATMSKKDGVPRQ